MEPESFANLFGPVANLGAFGLVAWLLRRVFTHTVPRLADDFKDSLDKTQELFRKELASTREMFAEELRSQRKDFREELQRERQELGSRLDRLAQAVESLVRDREFYRNGGKDA